MHQPFDFFPAQVVRKLQLTPSLTRITFHHPSLARFADPGFDQRIKLVFAPEEGIMDELVGNEDWFAAYRGLADEVRPALRTYTTRYVRHADAEVDVDMVNHAPLGPAAHWVRSAQPGDAIWLLGPAAGYEGEAGGVDFVPPAQTESLLLVGDETAAPAISVILEQLPATAVGRALVELPEQADAGYLPSHPGIEITALSRGAGQWGSKLIPAVSAAAAELVPAGTPAEVEEIDVDQELLWDVPRTAKGGKALKRAKLYAWIAGEAGMVKVLRRLLVAERGIDRRAVAFMGYWRLGRAES